MSIRISLIQTSQNRRNELTRFVNSLTVQKNIDFNRIQLIFVDQENNGDIFKPLDGIVELKIIKTEHCSLSHARNLALPFVKGDVVCFPDDDCWYEADTLYKVICFFEFHPEYDGVSGIGLNENNILTHVFPAKAQGITSENRCAAISYTMFYRFQDAVRFNEDIGVGSSYNLGAGEETDYMLNLMEKYNYKMFYDPNIVVHHPAPSDCCDKKGMLKKRYSYSRGAGYLMRLHKFSVRYCVRSFIRPFGGACIYCLRGDFYKMKMYMYIIKGLIEGYYFKKKHS